MRTHGVRQRAHGTREELRELRRLAPRRDGVLPLRRSVRDERDGHRRQDRHARASAPLRRGPRARGEDARRERARRGAVRDRAEGAAGVGGEKTRRAERAIRRARRDGQRQGARVRFFFGPRRRRELEHPGRVPDAREALRGRVHGRHGVAERVATGRADARERIRRQDRFVHSAHRGPRVRVREQRERVLRRADVREGRESQVRQAEQGGARGGRGGGGDGRRGRVGRGRLREERRARLRAVEGVQARGAVVGEPVGRGASRVAHRVQRDVQRRPGRGGGHQRRRDRSQLSAPRKSARAVGGVLRREAVGELLRAQRSPAHRRAEDVEESEELHHDTRRAEDVHRAAAAVFVPASPVERPHGFDPRVWRRGGRVGERAVRRV